MLAADVTCGLSLGEYTALTFAGAIRRACQAERLFGIHLFRLPLADISKTSQARTFAVLLSVSSAQGK